MEQIDHILGKTRDAAELLHPDGERSANSTALVSYVDRVKLASGWHYHEMHQLSFAFDGAIEVEAENGFHLVPRQIAAWIPAGVPHRMRLRQERSGTIWFSTDMIDDPEGRVRTILVNPLMREMLKEAMRWQMPEKRVKLGTDYFQAMAGLCREWLSNEANLFLPTAINPKIESVLGYTRENLDAKLAEVCRWAGISDRSLRRHLRAEIGMNWEAYRHQCRLMCAFTLLSESTLPISEVAVRSGFPDPSWFSKAFSAAACQTPGEYRRRIRDSLSQ